ncbi:MAG: DUF2191 domain-containing protein [Kiritimatiellia bacterium]
MRSTISIEDELLARAKEKALNRKCSLGEVINEALLISFSQESQSSTEQPFRLTTCGGKGMHPGINVNDNAALLDWMEQA